MATVSPSLYSRGSAVADGATVGVAGGDSDATAAAPGLGWALGDGTDVGTALGGGGSVGLGGTSVFVAGTAVAPKAGIAASSSAVRVALRGGRRAPSSRVGPLGATLMSVGDGVRLVGGSGPLAAAPLSARPTAGGEMGVALPTVGLASGGPRAAAYRGSLGRLVAVAGASERADGVAAWLFHSGYHNLLVRPRTSDGCSSGEAAAWLSSVPPRRSSSIPVRPASPGTQ